MGTGMEFERFVVQVGLSWILIACMIAAMMYAIRTHNARKKSAEHEHEVEGTVGGKFICQLRKNDNDPVLLVSSAERAKARKTGKCELMISVDCVNGYVFADRVAPRVFDAVEVGSQVTVRYVVNERTQERACRSIKPK